VIAAGVLLNETTAGPNPKPGAGAFLNGPLKADAESRIIRVEKNEQTTRRAPANCMVSLENVWESLLYEDSNRGRALIEQAVGSLATVGLLCFRISDLELDETLSRQLAVVIARTIAATLRKCGAPSSLRVEQDVPQLTEVPAGFSTRTLLPHHDCAHSSYLSPSRNDLPGLDERWRTFSRYGYTRTTTHKLFQGIFLIHPGEGLSLTTYYPWLLLVRRSFNIHMGREAAGVPELAAYIGENIKRAIQLREYHSGNYLTLPAALGHSSLLFHAVAPHCAEADFPQKTYADFPEIARIVDGCPCGDCPAPQARLFCRSLTETLDLDWRAFRNQYEMCVETRRYDFVIGHNLTLLHGGLKGGPSRLIEPIYLSIDSASGPEYERWLAGVWRNSQDRGWAWLDRAGAAADSVDRGMSG